MNLKTTIFLIAVLSFSRISFAQTATPTRSGKEIFIVNCVRCHGTDGTKAKWGAKNLQESALPDAKLTAIITHGKGIMPAWRKSLSQQEIEIVKDYVKTLRVK